MANKERFIGTEGYTEEGFAAMAKAVDLDHDIVRRAAKFPDSKSSSEPTRLPARTVATPKSSSIASGIRELIP